MDFGKLYENIVLRDILEYFVPGSIIVLSIAIVADSILNGLGVSYSFLANLSNLLLWQIVALILIAYSMGHLITAIEYKLRIIRKEEDKAKDGVKNLLSEDNWLKTKLVKAVAEYTDTPEAEVENLLTAESKTAKTIRQIGRSIIHARRQQLYREFVSRHSILSRFFRNMSHALTFLLISLIISVVVIWNHISALFQAAPVLFVFSVILVVVVLIAMILLFAYRETKIRKTMIEHTYQIWCVDYMLSRIESLEGNNND